MRILVDPQVLRQSASQVDRTASELQAAATRASSVLKQIPWEAREKAEIEQRAATMRTTSTRLVQQAHDLSRSLQQSAQRFEEADRAGAQGMGSAGASYQNFLAGWMNNPAGAIASLNMTPAQQQMLLGLLLAALFGGGGGSGKPGVNAGQNSSGGTWRRPDGDITGHSGLWDKDYRQPGEPGSFRPSVGFNMHGALTGTGGKVHHGSVAGIGTHGSASTELGAGDFSGGLGWGDKGPEAFVGVSAAAMATQAGGTLGGRNLGATGGASASFLSADGSLGYNPNDHSVSASIGGSLASVEGEVGANVAGTNVSANGEIGLKAELGIQLGQKNELRLPLVTIGFGFGGAK